MHMWPCLLINASLFLRCIIKGNIITTGFVISPKYRSICAHKHFNFKQPFFRGIGFSLIFHGYNGHHRMHALYLNKRNFFPLKTGAEKVVKYGFVVSCKGGMDFIVKLDNTEKPILCRLAGLLLKRRTFVAANARVKVECSLLDPESGRIIERL